MKCPNRVYLNEDAFDVLRPRLAYFECPACAKSLSAHELELRTDVDPAMVYVVDPQRIETLRLRQA